MSKNADQGPLSGEHSSLLSVTFFEGFHTRTKRVRDLVQWVIDEVGMEKFCNLIDTIGMPFDPDRTQGMKIWVLMERWRQRAFNIVTAQQDKEDDPLLLVEQMRWNIDTILGSYSRFSESEARQEMLQAATSLLQIMSEFFDDYGDGDDDNMVTAICGTGEPWKEAWQDRKNGKLEQDCHIAIRNTVEALYGYLSYIGTKDLIDTLSQDENKEEGFIQWLMDELPGYRQMINEWSWKVFGPSSFNDEYTDLDAKIGELIGIWQWYKLEKQIKERKKKKKNATKVAPKTKGQEQKPDPTAWDQD